jgi:hypothetical protein
MFKRITVLLLCGLCLVPVGAQDDAAWVAWLYSDGRALLVDSTGKVQKTVTLPLPEGEWTIDSSRMAVSHNALLIAYVLQQSEGFEQWLQVMDTDGEQLIATIALPHPENGPLNANDTLFLTASEAIFHEDDTALAFSYFLEGEGWAVVVFDIKESRIGDSLQFDDAIIAAQTAVQPGVVPRVGRFRQGVVEFVLAGESAAEGVAFAWDSANNRLLPSVAFSAFPLDTFAATGEVVRAAADTHFVFENATVAIPQLNALHVYDPELQGSYPFYADPKLGFFSVTFVQGGERVLAGAWDVDAKPTWLLLEREGKVARRFQDTERHYISGTPDGFIYLTSSEGKIVLIEVNTRDFDPGRTVWVGEGEWQIIGVKQHLPETLEFDEWAQLAEPLTVELLEVTDEPTAPTPLPTPAPLLRPGIEVRVQTEEDEYLNLRSGPGTEYEVLLLLKDDTRLTLLEGPQEADGFVWWKVRTTTGIEGWVVETVGGLHSLVP